MTARKKHKLPVSEQASRNSKTSPWRKFTACRTRAAYASRARLDAEDQENDRVNNDSDV